MFKDGLITLLKYKTLYSIAVTELCDTTELNRSIFYKYYENIYDVFDDIEYEALLQYKKVFQK